MEFIFDDIQHRPEGRNTDLYNDPDVQLSHKVFIVIGLIYIPIIVFSNILIFFGILLYPGFYNSNNIFLLSLAIFDFLLGFVALPILVMTRVPSLNSVIAGNKYLCLFKSASIGFSASGSLYSLLIISVDRYLAILFPLKYKTWVTTERAVKVVAGLWVYTLFRVSLPALGWNTYNSTEPRLSMRCEMTKSLPSLYITIFISYPGQVLLLISTLINIHITVIVYRQIKSFKMEKSVWTTEQIQTFDARISSIKITLVLTVLFIILWVPFYLVLPLKLNNVISKKTAEIMRTATGICSFANSMVNAPIYAAMRSEYRNVYRVMITTVPWRWKPELKKLHRDQSSAYSASMARESSFTKASSADQDELKFDAVSLCEKNNGTVPGSEKGSRYSKSSIRTVDPAVGSSADPKKYNKERLPLRSEVVEAVNDSLLENKIDRKYTTYEIKPLGSQTDERSRSSSGYTGNKLDLDTTYFIVKPTK
ncbi:adenosine receptor A2b-like [Physella acuta]|uniref:adenosine receptor A2b-like n=1 Tax=Physella acuta TaxID=109671 RepID=UPI0027DC73C7|nr:adenosine receptor A2b-like [Physella acuta]